VARARTAAEARCRNHAYLAELEQDAEGSEIDEASRPGIRPVPSHDDKAARGRASGWASGASGRPGRSTMSPTGATAALITRTGPCAAVGGGHRLRGIRHLAINGPRSRRPAGHADRMAVSVHAGALHDAARPHGGRSAGIWLAGSPWQSSTIHSGVVGARPELFDEPAPPRRGDLFWTTVTLMTLSVPMVCWPILGLVQALPGPDRGECGQAAGSRPEAGSPKERASAAAPLSLTPGLPAPATRVAESPHAVRSGWAAGRLRHLG
jgi:hypothetical protein